VIFGVGLLSRKPSSFPGDSGERLSGFISQNGVHNRKIQFVNEKF